MRLPCRVIQYSDQEHCEVCTLTWDVNEQFPPQCPHARDVRNPSRQPGGGMAAYVVAASLWLQMNGARALAPPVLALGVWLFKRGW